MDESRSHRTKFDPGQVVVTRLGNRCVIQGYEQTCDDINGLQTVYHMTNGAEWREEDLELAEDPKAPTPEKKERKRSPLVNNEFKPSKVEMKVEGVPIHDPFSGICHEGDLEDGNMEDPPIIWDEVNCEPLTMEDMDEVKKAIDKVEERTGIRPNMMTIGSQLQKSFKALSNAGGIVAKQMAEALKSTKNNPSESFQEFEKAMIDHISKVSGLPEEVLKFPIPERTDTFSAELGGEIIQMPPPGDEWEQIGHQELKRGDWWVEDYESGEFRSVDVTGHSDEDFTLDLKTDLQRCWLKEYGIRLVDEHSCFIMSITHWRKKQPARAGNGDLKWNEAGGFYTAYDDGSDSDDLL